MIPHRKDQAFVSTPVSRVGSSARLNQLMGASGPGTSSRPATPSAYVTSSLNPARNLPVSSNNTLLKLGPGEVALFEKVPVVEHLRDFEASFNALSQSITSFKETELVSEVESLIDLEDKITAGLSVLESHHRLGTEIQALTKTNEELDLHSKNILKELISCRAKLRALPKLPASPGNAQHLNDVDVQTVLDYAMKLAKFSKAPATVLSQFMHPNNYIWPAEDALRRGMLATASIKPDELIHAEIGPLHLLPGITPLSGVDGGDVAMADADGPIADDDSVSRPAAVKPNGSVSASVGALASKPAAATLDLDLFDPEDDEDDSD